MKKHLVIPALVLASLLGVVASSLGQAVAVTMRLDTNSIAVGENTMLRVYAQIVPSLRPETDRIFSWYVDVLNTNGAVAQADYASLLKPASDNDDPPVSSTGFNDGANRRGIYDTFMDLPAAGRDAPVELLRIPVTGLAEGQTRFSVREGSGGPELTDFLVAPTGGGEEFVGGDYNLADIDLEVIAVPCELELSIMPDPGSNGPLPQLILSFTPCPGYDHTVEYRDDLSPGSTWQALPGGPHNSGSISITGSLSQRFYRVRATKQTGGANAH